MGIGEIVGFASTFIGMAFGFGRQSANIATMRRDIDGIEIKEREQVTPMLNKILVELAEMRKDIEYLKNKH